MIMVAFIPVGQISGSAKSLMSGGKLRDEVVGILKYDCSQLQPFINRKCATPC